MLPLPALVNRLSGSVHARGVAVVFALNAGAALFGLLLQLTFARLMGPGDFGLFMLAMAWLNILAVPALGGFDTYVLRAIPQYSVTDRPEALRALMRQAPATVLVLGVLTGAFGALFVEYAPHISVFADMTAQTYGGVLLAAFAILPLWALMILISAMMRGLGMTAKARVPETIIRPGLLLALFLLAAGLDHAGAETAMLLNGIAVAAALGVSVVWLQRGARPKMCPAACEARTDNVRPRYTPLRTLGESLPFSLFSGLSVLMRRADMVLVGMLLGPASAGLYAAALAISNVAVLGMNSINNITAPLFSKCHYDNDSAGLAAVERYSRYGIAALTIASAAMLSLLAPLILSLFGAAFKAAATAAIILLAGQAAASLAGPVHFLMTMTGRHGAALLVHGAAVIANIALNAALIPAYGIEGAATATALATLIWKFSLLACHRLCKKSCTSGTGPETIKTAAKKGRNHDTA